jgi:hypothetical protein
MQDELEEKLPGDSVLHLTDVETGRTLYLDAANTRINIGSKEASRPHVHWFNLSTDGSHLDKLVHGLSRLRLHRRVLR